MQFEALQQIWNEQEDEMLFAIDRETLHKRVSQKSRSLTHVLNIFEWSLIGSNIVSIIVLYMNWAGDGVPVSYYLVPAILIIITGYLLRMRTVRKVRLAQYDHSLMGDLDRALAQNRFILDRVQTMVWWYVLPVFGGFTLFFYVQKGPFWWQSMLLMVVVAALSYAGGRWELNKFYRPNQRDLEALRNLLLNPE